jgi:hypothetical protein
MYDLICGGRRKEGFACSMLQMDLRHWPALF